MASSAAERKEGAAFEPPPTSPPSPLANPVDALVDELLTRGRLVIKTRDTRYTLTMEKYDDVRVQYNKFGVFGVEREWHALGGPNHLALHALIAAIVSENSYESASMYNRKLWSMECGSMVMTPKRRVQSPPSVSRP